MFKDKVKLHIKAGDGGNGRVDFDKIFKASGGDGGNGGNVILKGSIHLYDLSKFNPGKKYEAQDAEHGKPNKMHGADGKDLVIEVPLATVIYNPLGEIIAEISEDEEQVIVLEGGIGGMGNAFYSKRGRQYREKAKPGLPGEEMMVDLELELKSDVIFIGYPNAGKSSLLREITNADAKVAAYAFTTLIPQLGQMEGTSITLMDLPGLIEGAHEGKGLGTEFEKHTRWAQYVAHFVSFENKDMFDAYETMREELKEIDRALYDKPEIIILSKSDLVERPERIKLQKQFENKYNRKIIVLSSFDLESLEEFKALIIDKLSRDSNH